jgi:DNA-binding Lrp family transcriptional regulator
VIQAYVLAKIEAGRDKEVLKQIKSINGVRKASATYGTYDLFVDVTFESIEELDEFVFNKLRKILEVKETVTVICSETIT